MKEEQWEIIDEQRVWIGSTPHDDDDDYFRTDYIVKNTITGELRRI